MRTSHSQAFTLVELAIVLVIIGLLVGGVLVGADLIRAATIRSQTAQLDQFTAGVQTFQNKYAGLPGDIQNTKAASFGFAARAGDFGRGDGNLLIQSGGGAMNVLGGENTLFWRDLSESQLISTKFDTTTDGPAASLVAMPAFLPYLPQTKLNPASFVHVLSVNGRHFYFLARFESTDGSGVITTSPGITVWEAKSIDEKFDDAYPQSGVVSAVTDLGVTLAFDTPAAPADGVCVVSSTPVTYNLGSSYRDQPNCRLLIRGSF